MSAPRTGRTALAAASGTLLLLVTGCGYYAGGGYGYGDSAGIGVNYYEPGAFDYGGWGGGYNVAPFRGGRDGGYHGGGGGGHAYRSAPAAHGTPSVSSHLRQGGPR